jgi:hypothetical protein
VAKRQKIQRELAFGTVATGEARSAAPQGSETSTAASRAEIPAASGPRMEAVVERDNLRKAPSRAIWPASLRDRIDGSAIDGARQAQQGRARRRRDDRRPTASTSRRGIGLWPMVAHARPCCPS